MTHPQQHHYVSNFLLGSFEAGEKKQIQVFDKQNGKVFASKANKLAKKRYYYDFEFMGVKLTLEPGLQEIEDRAARRVKQIIEDGCLHHDQPMERVELARFIAIQLVRTPAQQEKFRDFGDRLETYLRKEGMSEDFFKIDPKLGDKDNAERVLMARQIVNASKAYTSVLLDKDWVLMEANPTHPFIIGDHPVIMHNDVDHGPRGSLGLLVRGIEIYIPLSPTLILALWCKTHYQELLARVEKLDELSTRNPEYVMQYADGWKESLKLIEAIQTGKALRSHNENIVFANSLQISSAERFVFSSSSDFSLAQDMISESDDLRYGARIAEATGKF